MISIKEAVELIRQNLPESKIEYTAVTHALGRYLADDIVSPEASPRYTSSAMDGFAFKYIQEMAERDGYELELIGESAAGNSFAGTLGVGEAVRINTGAVIPAGADTVIRLEDTTEEDGKVLLSKVPRQGQDIRYAGEEFKENTVILEKNTRLSAPHLALLAATGIQQVPVYRPCRVSLLVTGSELVTCGEEIGPDQIRDSNMTMMKEAIAEAGGVVISAVRVVDDEDATRQAIGKADGDIVICTGGISVGRHDHVKGAATEVGFEEIFWRIRQKPGKPLFFARRGDQLFFGLPGNPVSAFMCFIHYIKPMIGAVLGFPFGWPVISARVVAPIVNRGGRPTMIRVCLRWQKHQGYSITHAEKQGSHMLTSLTSSQGYILLMPGESRQEGDLQDVFCYDSRQDIQPSIDVEPPMTA